MPDLNLDEIEKRCEALRADAVFGHRANRAILDARTDIPALVERLKGEPERVKAAVDNALEEAAKICDRLKVAECLARHDEDDDIWNDALDQAIEKIRALKTNKGGE